MLHLELGFASLFSYCVEALGMSEGAAGRRVAAARVCQRFSGAFERVARGQLHLCALCALAPHLTADNATELMDACCGKTRRQVEELLAVRFPRPDVREQIRRLPARTVAAVTEQASPVAQAVESCAPPPESVEMSSGKTLGQSPAISANLPSPPTGAVATPTSAASPDSRRRARGLEPLAADRFGVHVSGKEPLSVRACLRRTRPNSGQGLLREATFPLRVRPATSEGSAELFLLHAGDTPKRRVSAHTPGAHRKLGLQQFTVQMKLGKVRSRAPLPRPRRRRLRRYPP